jgi:hypothetical protein
MFFTFFGSVNNNEDEQDEKDKGATEKCILKKESSNIQRNSFF